MLSFVDESAFYWEAPKKPDQIDDPLLSHSHLTIYKTYYTRFCGKTLKDDPCLVPGYFQTVIPLKFLISNK